MQRSVCGQSGTQHALLVKQQFHLRQHLLHVLAQLAMVDHRQVEMTRGGVAAAGKRGQIVPAPRGVIGCRLTGQLRRLLAKLRFLSEQAQAAASKSGEAPST